MYLYFDNAGTLKEIFTADPTRQGASDWNKIHSYWESTSGTITGCLIRYARPDVNPFDENAVSIEVAYNTKGNAELPYDSKKDVKFFEYFKNYYFYNFVIPDTVLGVEGPVIATIYYIVSIDGVSTTIPMGMFTFQVEPNATQKVKYDDYISISQWNYLVERLSNLEDGFIQGDHTLDGDITYNGDVVFSNTASATFYCPTTFEGISVSITNVDFTFADSNSTIAGGPLTIYGSIYFDEDYYVKFGTLLEIDGELNTILPVSNNTTELGSSSKRFKNIYAADINVNSLTVNNSVKSSLNPSLNNYFDLGASNKKWARLYCVELNADGVNTNLVPTGATQTLGVKNGYWWAGVYADDAVFTDVDIQGTLKTNSGTGMRFEGSLLPKTSGAYNVGSSTLQWNSVYSVAGIFSASLNANGGELTVGSSQTIIQHLLVQSSMTVPIAPTFSNGATISGTITDGTYSWTVSDVAGVLALFGDDADSVVNKINEVLDIFENYPEGDDLVSVLATKFDKSSILTSYDSASVSNTTVYSALCTKTAIDTILGYFDSNGIAKKALADENGDNIASSYVHYTDITISGGVVIAINDIPVASEVNVSGQPIPVSSTDDMTDETKMYWLTTDGYIYYYDGNDWVQTTQKLFDPSSSLIPAINHDISLGSDSKRWLSGYFNELYVGSEGNNIFSIDDEGNIVFNNQPTFNDGVKIPSGEVLTDGTYSISVEEIVNKKVNVDANVPTLTSGMADNLTPYNENSGDNQTEPFIFQATGTANGNKPDYSTKSYALLQEKQGNSVVYNQLFNPTSFGSSTTVATVSITKNTDSITLNGTASSNSTAYTIQGRSIISNHKYLIICPNNIAISQSQTWNSNYGSYILTANATTSMDFKLYLHSGDSYNNFTFTPYLIDLTKWYGSNDNIPSALLDNPSLFPMNYRGSLSSNVGEIVNSNARYLDCIDINQCDEIFEGGGISSSGQNESSSNSFRTTNYQPVIPNSTYCLHTANGIASSYYLFEYDVNNNFIKSTEKYSNNSTYSLSSNTYYVRLVFYKSGSSYQSNVPSKDVAQITLNISDNNINGTYYPYKLLTHLDTGTEVLRSVGSVKDVKKPNGVITRKVGVVKLKDLTYTYNATYQVFYATITGKVNNKNNGGLCESYNLVSTNPDGLSQAGDLLNNKECALSKDTSNPYIYIKDSSYSDGTTFKNHFTDDEELYFELATPTEEQGTTFSENLVINDYGTMNWNNTSFNGIPMGNLIFYPVDYKAFIDTLYNYSSGTPSNIALKSDIKSVYLHSVNMFNTSNGVVSLTIINTDSSSYNTTSALKTAISTIQRLGGISGTYKATIGGATKTLIISYAYQPSGQTYHYCMGTCLDGTIETGASGVKLEDIIDTVQSITDSATKIN